MARVSIALGSNLGDRLAWLAEARQRLDAVLTASRMSSIYETDPVGYDRQPQYLNAVITGTTDLAPLDLLHAMQQIETDLGRERPFPNAPRTIDLDLLFYDDLVLETPELWLPHPRLHERFFVLVPLAEIEPERRHPRLNQTVENLLAGLGPPVGLTRFAADTSRSTPLER